MGSTIMDNGSGDTAVQSRREALKKFGRYAALAPTAMVLLQPRETLAKNSKSGGGGKGGKKGHGFDPHY
jgi:hypothetical protein